ncbi:MAG: Stk1 family PASTA domain-containing Ser/Thr kinase [Oscillospiraceae bacterium]|nr:Stk1 family PASTA domain-containing Ser/Thr kinase [Oscillospiraceae bacterium]
MDLVGKILGNRYEIIEEVGCGGMAKVYKAKCRLLNRFVAVKVLRDDLKNDSEFIRRFNVESQAAASLSHTNVVPIYDVGEENGVHYIVMEYVEGETLKEYIEQQGALEWPEALNFAAQICRALEVAHKNFIIHRDIKPHNIIVTPDKILKVTDFGIARANNEATMTNEGNTIGSVQYISPEQARGGYTDEKTDLYSAGVVLYEMTTGRVPFGNTGAGDPETAVAIALKHIQEAPVPPREYNLAIPKSVEGITLKAMAKEQLNRYSSAAQMLADLEKVMRNPDVRIGGVIAESSIDRTQTMHMQAVSDNEIRSIRKNPNAPQSIPRVPKAQSSKEEDFDRFFEQESRSKRDNHDNVESQSKKGSIAKVAKFGIPAIIIGILAFWMLWMTGIIGGVTEITIPDLVGEDLNAMILRYNDRSRFEIVEARRIESDEDEDTIISQNPVAGRRVRDRGETIEITVTVSRGSEEDPNGDDDELVLRNYVTERADYRDAVAELEEFGAQVAVTREANDTVPEHVVISQFPAAGTTLRIGDTVSLRVSSGPEDDPNGNGGNNGDDGNGPPPPPPPAQYEGIFTFRNTRDVPTNITIRAGGRVVNEQVRQPGEWFDIRVVSSSSTTTIEVLHNGVVVTSNTETLRRVE